MTVRASMSSTASSRSRKAACTRTLLKQLPRRGDRIECVASGRPSTESASARCASSSHSALSSAPISRATRCRGAHRRRTGAACAALDAGSADNAAGQRSPARRSRAAHSSCPPAPTPRPPAREGRRPRDLRRAGRSPSRPATDVPPNLMTITSAHESRGRAIPPAAPRSATDPPAAPRIMLWPSATRRRSRIGSRRTRPTVTVMPLPAFTSRRGCGRLTSRVTTSHPFRRTGQSRAACTSPFQLLSASIASSAVARLASVTDRHGHVPMLHGHAVGLRADANRRRTKRAVRTRRASSASPSRSSPLRRRHERDHVAEDVERWHTGIAGPRHGLQGRDEAPAPRRTLGATARAPRHDGRGAVRRW